MLHIVMINLIIDNGNEGSYFLQLNLLASKV